jgi:hypothetical protein
VTLALELGSVHNVQLGDDDEVINVSEQQMSVYALSPVETLELSDMQENN